MIKVPRSIISRARISSMLPPWFKSGFQVSIRGPSSLCKYEGFFKFCGLQHTMTMFHMKLFNQMTTLWVFWVNHKPNQHGFHYCARSLQDPRYHIWEHHHALHTQGIKIITREPCTSNMSTKSRAPPCNPKYIMCVGSKYFFKGFLIKQDVLHGLLQRP